MPILNLTEGFAPYGKEPKMNTIGLSRNKIFSGGEIDVALDTAIPHDNVMITTRLVNSDDVMQLLMATDALRRRGAKNINVFFPYCPYARQDRVCGHGEAFSLEVFAKLINAQNYQSVTVFDTHSAVATSLINNCKNISPAGFASSIINSYYGTLEDKPAESDYFLIAPDSGAAKKVQAVWDMTDCENPPVVFFKKRGIGGQIDSIETSLHSMFGKDAWIVDDICDGGRTFIALTKKLKEMNVGNVFLIVSHGIFSYGTKCLEDAGIEHVWTTDSFPEKASDYDLITRMSLSDLI